MFSETTQYRFNNLYYNEGIRAIHPYNTENEIYNIMLNDIFY